MMELVLYVYSHYWADFHAAKGAGISGNQNSKDEGFQQAQSKYLLVLISHFVIFLGQLFI